MTNIHEEISSNFILTKSFIEKYLFRPYQNSKRINIKLLTSLNKKYNQSYNVIDIWKIYYNLETPKCKNRDCTTNKTPAFLGFKIDCDLPYTCFRGYCCNSCAQSSLEEIQKTKNKKKLLYGDSNFNNREKSKLSCLEKYGVEHISQSEIIKMKKIDTCLKNNSVMYPMQSEAVRLKSRETCLERYGFEIASKSDAIKHKIKETCLERYGETSILKTTQFKEKAKLTLLKNYGVVHQMHSNIVKGKIKETCLERYGVEYTFQSEAIRLKSRKTCLERYGVEHNMQSSLISSKSKETCLERYGVENPMHSSLIRKKLKEKCLERYGVENPMQDGNIAEKCMIKAKQFKIFKLPSGKEIKFQGYEDQLIKILLNKHKEEEILFSRKDMPKIFYTTSDGKTHRYYPDIFVPNTNTIYEVKSEYTLNKDLDINLRKFDAVKEMGYNFELHVF